VLAQASVLLGRTWPCISFADMAVRLASHLPFTLFGFQGVSPCSPYGEQGLRP
jgi:hypothetical protein